MKEIVRLEIWQFSLVYLLLLIVLAVMKRSQVKQSRLLLLASVRMSVQLLLAGFILTYIFERPHPLFIVAYLLSMIAFASYRILKANQKWNRRFKEAIVLSLSVSGLLIVIFFVAVVVGESLFNPQYVIPISGMIFGNSMTGISLGLKSFGESLAAERSQMETLLNFGVAPKDILLPFVNRSLETALLPTLNSMLGMGIIALPGMMTGQILSGTLPTTAILYQIAIMISITTVVCLSVWAALFLGYRTLYNKRQQFIFDF